MFEMVNNRRVIFGERKIEEIQASFSGMEKRRYFLRYTAKKVMAIRGLPIFLKSRELNMSATMHFKENQIFM